MLKDWGESSFPQDLDLRGCEISDEQVTALRSQHPNCEIVGEGDRVRDRDVSGDEDDYEIPSTNYGFL